MNTNGQDTIALKEAIRAITVDAPNDQPNGEAERLIDVLLSLLDREQWSAAPNVQGRLFEVNDTMASLCEALANDCGRLRKAADRYFGEDFTKPAP